MYWLPEKNIMPNPPLGISKQNKNQRRGSLTLFHPQVFEREQNMARFSFWKRRKSLGTPLLKRSWDLHLYIKKILMH
jgi:thymidylate synthase